MLDNLNVLYAEDEEIARENLYDIFSLITKNLKACSNGKEALDYYYQNKKDIDIVVLDVEMPFINGIEVAKKIREHNKDVQIIITTAYTDPKYTLKAIELDLVTYLVKPINAIELKNAFNKAKQRIYNSQSMQIPLEKNLFYDLCKKTIIYNDKEIKLTNNEIELMELLIKNINNLVTYESISYNVWEKKLESMTADSLRTLVRDLRKKLPTNLISNISKQGYVLNASV